MAIADVIAQLTAKVQAKDAATVTQILQNCHDNLCLAYGLDLTATASGMFDKNGNPLTIGQALTIIGQVAAPLRLQAAVLATLQNAVNAVPSS
jgi:hypothetical protein